jgi:AcrR family transcriptional regulator
MSAPVQEVRRRDARRNREAILCAARELFAESGAVAMCEVARRAGVGQATLYRNFPDRDALLRELLDQEIEDIERLAAEHAGDPDAFFVLLRGAAQMVARCHAISELAGEADPHGTQIDDRRRRLAAVFRSPLQQAKAAGTVRRDLTVEDVFQIVRMVKGAVEDAGGAAARAAAAGRALALVLDGLLAG